MNVLVPADARLLSGSVAANQLNDLSDTFHGLATSAREIASKMAIATSLGRTAVVEVGDVVTVNDVVQPPFPEPATGEPN